jgi:hypothetical protein
MAEPPIHNCGTGWVKKAAKWATSRKSFYRFQPQEDRSVRPHAGKTATEDVVQSQFMQITACTFTFAKNHATDLPKTKEIVMKHITLLCGLILATTGLSVQAGGLSGSLQEECQDDPNTNDDECLLLPPIEEATNFVLPIAPLLGSAAAIGLIAAAAGGGGAGGSGIGIGTSTPSSTQ